MKSFRSFWTYVIWNRIFLIVFFISLKTPGKQNPRLKSPSFLPLFLLNDLNIRKRPDWGEGLNNFPGRRLTLQRRGLPEIPGLLPGAFLSGASCIPGPHREFCMQASGLSFLWFWEACRGRVCHSLCVGVSGILKAFSCGFILDWGTDY